MKKFSLLRTAAVAGTLLVSSTVLAGAATVQDQVSDSSSNVSYHTGLHWQQKVVAGVTGILKSIELNFGAGLTNADVFVNLGSGWQSDADEFLVSLTGLAGFTTIDVSAANISLTSGDVFSIGIRNGSGGDFRGSSGNVYAAGGLFLDGAAFVLPDYDLNFRTNVETAAAVPLPAGLPLLLAGLGGLALLRRKQKA